MSDNQRWHEVNTIERLSGFCQVYTNGSGELFIQARENGPKIRITPDIYGEMVITTSEGGRLTPWACNGLEAFRVRKDRV